MCVDGRVDCIGKVGHGKHFLICVAYGNVKVRMTVFVSVLVAYVGKNRALCTVYMNVDAFVEPCFFEFETMFGVVTDFYSFAFVLDGDFTDFNAVYRFGGVFFSGISRFLCAVEFHLEQSAVEPGTSKIRDAVKGFACYDREILPEGPFGHLGAFDKCAEAVTLGLVLFGDFFFPVVVKFLFAYAENFLDGSIEGESVVF